MKFTKMQGLGNDFVIVDARNLTLPTDLADWSKKLCDRHFGIGADGLMLVLPSECADIRMQILNSDGSEAEMCGNGIRCFAKFVYEEGLVKNNPMTVETLAGLMVPEVVLDASGQVVLVTVDMGEPRLTRAEIPMLGDNGQVIDETLHVAEKPFQITAVSMGNPHCVTFVDDIGQADLEKWGPLLEHSPSFPKKTNVEFVQVLNRQEVIMRVWERGASITMACGTGACATAVACVLNGRTERKITVHLDGGDLKIDWDEASNHIFMTGAAETVFAGEI